MILRICWVCLVVAKVVVVVSQHRINRKVVVKNFRLDDKIKILLGLGIMIVAAAILVITLSPYGEMLKNIISPATTTTPPPPPPPTDDVMWDSDTNGHWNNGKNRVITSSHQFDPDDKKTEVSAGSNRRFEVRGDGTALLSGDRARIYIHVNNYNAQMEISYIPNPSLDNTLSLRLRSRHNEPDPHDNRFGGYGVTVSLDEGEPAREEYHNEHTSFPDFKLPRKMDYGKMYTLRYSVHDTADGKQVEMWLEIDYDNKGKFIEVGRWKDPKPLPYMLDKALYLKKSYVWVRVNGQHTGEEEGPKDVEIKKLIIRSLD
jgi:hypothetical protein